MSNSSNRKIEPLLTIPEVAGICRVNEKTIRRWIKADDLAAIKLGTQWRIAQKDLNHFLRERWTG